MTDMLTRPVADTTKFGANPAIRPKTAPVVNAPALKSGAAGAPPTPGATTQPTPAPAGTAPAGDTSGYGTAGNLTNVGANFDPSKLPPWLASQFFQTPTNTGSEGGAPQTQWSYQYNLKDQQGNPIVQIGSGYQVAGQGGDGGGVIDPSKVTYDPMLGYITSPDNIKTVHAGGAWDLVGPAAIPLILGAGLGLDALYGFNGFGAAETAGTGAFDVGGSTGFGGTMPLDASGAAGLGDTSALAPFPTTTIPSLGDVPGIADSLTPSINQAIDTSFMPPVTPTTIPDLPSGLPTIPDVPPVIPPAGGGGGGVPPAYDPFTSQNIANTLTQGEFEAPPPGGAGSPNFLDSTLSKLTADPLRTLSGAATVGSLIAGGRGGSAIPSSLTNTVDANKPIQQQAQTTLTNNGAPSADQLATINATIAQQRQQGTEAIIQASVNAGQGGKDSMVVQDKIRAFNTQLATLQMQMVQKQASENISVALQELGLMNSEQFALAQLEINQSNENMQRIMSIMQSLGWLFSVGGGK